MSFTFKYKTATFSINSSKSTFQFFHPSDADELLRSISDEQSLKDMYQPYWMEHWPSAEIFFTFISKYPFPSRLNILELGCGLGILSVALLSKNQNVFSIDISPDACTYCRSNILSNGFLPKVICADLRNLPLQHKFDLIIASDILYEEKMNRIFLDSIYPHINTTSKIWVADPCRRGWNSFKEKATAKGYSVNILHTQKTNDKKITVEIIELVRSK